MLSLATPQFDESKLTQLMAGPQLKRKKHWQIVNKLIKEMPFLSTLEDRYTVQT